MVCFLESLLLHIPQGLALAHLCLSLSLKTVFCSWWWCLRAAPAARGSSQARGWIGAAALAYATATAMPHLSLISNLWCSLQQCWILNTSSRILVGFLTHWATWEILPCFSDWVFAATPSLHCQLLLASSTWKCHQLFEPTGSRRTFWFLLNQHLPCSRFLFVTGLVTPVVP